MKEANSRGSWSGFVGFVLAAMGSAVGLGNVWRFPYITGVYGGSVFIIVYIGCVALVGVPIMIAEFLIGRKTQRNAVGAFRSLSPGSPWILIGWLGLLSGFVILSYYSVVGGWVLHYIYLALAGGFADKGPNEISALFSALEGNPFIQIFWHAIFMLLTIMIVAGGIERGIELGNKIMMPALFLLLCALMIYALQADGAEQALNFLLYPRWENFGPKAVLVALGQALFSLSLGMGAMITYGSYMTKRTNLLRSAFYVATGDTLVAFFAGLVVFPLVFTFHLEPTAGPGLLFRTLPTAFAQLPGTHLVAFGFFLLIAFAALTSAISLLEVVSAYFIDERGWKRTQASWTLGGIIFILGIPSAVGEKFFGLMDSLATNFLLPIGALLIAFFTGWVLNKEEKQSGFESGEISGLAYGSWLVLIQYLSPLAVTLIFLHQLGVF